MPVTEYTWDPVTDSILEETDGAGNVLATYTNEPSAYGPLLSQHRGGVTRHFHFDALGSTRQLTDDAGNVTDAITDDAWGNEVARSGNSETQYRRVGRWGYCRSTDTYVRVRSVSPEISHWSSRDLDDSIDRPHPFMYVQNGAPLHIDPSGMQTICQLGTPRLGSPVTEWYCLGLDFRRLL